MICWMQRTYAWSGWEWVRWASRPLSCGLMLGAIADVIVRVIA